MWVRICPLYDQSFETICLLHTHKECLSSVTHRFWREWSCLKDLVELSNKLNGTTRLFSAVFEIFALEDSEKKRRRKIFLGKFHCILRDKCNKKISFAVNCRVIRRKYYEFSPGDMKVTTSSCSTWWKTLCYISFVLNLWRWHIIGVL